MYIWSYETHVSSVNGNSVMEISRSIYATSTKVRKLVHTARGTVQHGIALARAPCSTYTSFGSGTNGSLLLMPVFLSHRVSSADTPVLLVSSSYMSLSSRMVFGRTDEDVVRLGAGVQKQRGMHDIARTSSTLDPTSPGPSPARPPCRRSTLRPRPRGTPNYTWRACASCRSCALRG